MVTFCNRKKQTSKKNLAWAKKFCLYIKLLGMTVFLFSNESVLAGEDSTVQFSITGTLCTELGPLLDKNYITYTVFEENGTLIISSDEEIFGLYLEWYNRPNEYDIFYDDIERKGGEYGFLHEFIEISEGTKQVVLSFKCKAELSNVYAYGREGVPENIQRWELPCENADILVCSTHADDEILFLGGVLAEYAGERELEVQVLYFFDYTNTWRVREHEKLDGLWEAGVRHYPDMGSYKEAAVASLNHCREIYGYDDCVNWLVGKIRKYRPLVCVTQDEKGEYLHLYEDNSIVLDTRKPLENFSGRTALEVAEEAYEKHVTQQEFWFYVSDTNEYSIAKFGLYRSLVGIDSGNDMMENVIPYRDMNVEEETGSIIQEQIIEEYTDGTTEIAEYDTTETTESYTIEMIKQESLETFESINYINNAANELSQEIQNEGVVEETGRDRLVCCVLIALCLTTVYLGIRKRMTGKK